MGWTFQQRSKGTSNKDWFSELLDGADGNVVDTATVGGTCYIAYRARNEAGDEITYALVALTQWRPYDAYNFGYKLMDESMGPGEDRCPERILALLSPLGEMNLGEKGIEWASNWRESCMEYHRLRKLRGSVSCGEQVLFSEPIRFSDGVSAERFEWVKGSGFYRMSRIGGEWVRGAQVRIRNWRQMDWAKA